MDIDKVLLPSDLWALATSFITIAEIGLHSVACNR